jgi:glyoxylase-like metal-dependent hydrolase (beta-lactamase superfamily II)
VLAASLRVAKVLVLGKEQGPDSLLVSPDLGLGDEQELEVGGLRLQFLHVPGH